MYFLNSKLLVSISVIALTTTLSANKPSWADKGKPPTAKEREAHKESMKSKGKNKKNKNIKGKAQNYKNNNVETLHQIPNPFAN